MSPEGIKYSVIAFLVGVLIVIGMYFVFQPPNTIHITENTAPQQIKPATPQPPPPPEVTAEIQKLGKQNNLIIVWSNLPDGTTVLKIYRAKKGTTNWSLWKTVTVDNSPEARKNGQTSIAIDNSGYTYTYYVEAVRGSSGNSSSTGSGGDTLWTSTPIDPIVTTSTIPTPPQPQEPSSTPPNNTTPSSSATSTPPPPQPSSTPSTGNPTSSPQTPNNYWYYYKPQGGVSGTSTPTTDNFWVQHIDNKIEIGWQNLPSSTDRFIIYRSLNTDGPWTKILEQQNPVIVGPSQVMVVDESLGTPYYYNMKVFQSNTELSSYGPIYLPGI